jgi:hypothetical protein
MAHFIAEKMAIAISSHGAAKSSAQRDCFEAILLLWDYRSCFPNEIRPFANFEPILRALAHIDPNKTEPSFFRNENSEKRPPKEIEQAVTFITNLDAAARIMISFFVQESMLLAKDQSTLEWLSAISGLARSDETEVLLNFIAEFHDNSTDQKEKRKYELKEQIERLQAFENLSQKMKSILISELEQLERVSGTP